MREVAGEKYYSPREIAEEKMITNSKGNGDYGFVLRLINRGELDHMVFNMQSKIPYKLVPESSVKKYKARFETTQSSNKGE